MSEPTVTTTEGGILVVDSTGDLGVWGEPPLLPAQVPDKVSEDSRRGPVGAKPWESELPAARWDDYRGNNHREIPRPDMLMGGSVSFEEHLGRPLSQSLWNDLVHRLGIRGLCVYSYGQVQWTIGWGQGHACVQLDRDGDVSDIDFVPYWRPQT